MVFHVQNKKYKNICEFEIGGKHKKNMEAYCQVGRGIAGDLFCVLQVF